MAFKCGTKLTAAPRVTFSSCLILERTRLLVAFKELQLLVAFKFSL